jgi:hypothetical protein
MILVTFLITDRGDAETQRLPWLVAGLRDSTSSWTGVCDRMKHMILAPRTTDAGTRTERQS